MKEAVLIIDDDFVVEENKQFYTAISQKYELHLAGYSPDHIELDAIDVSRIFLPDHREKIEYIEQDFISVCMLFIQIYEPHYVYFRKNSSLLSANAIDKICAHAELCKVECIVHNRLQYKFEKRSLKSITDEATLYA